VGFVGALSCPTLLCGTLVSFRLFSGRAVQRVWRSRRAPRLRDSAPMPGVRRSAGYDVPGVSDAAALGSLALLRGALSVMSRFRATLPLLEPNNHNPRCHANPGSSTSPVDLMRAHGTSATHARRACVARNATATGGIAAVPSSGGAGISRDQLPVHALSPFVARHSLCENWSGGRARAGCQLLLGMIGLEEHAVDHQGIDRLVGALDHQLGAELAVLDRHHRVADVLLQPR
jgi:hypothetical protein